MPLPFIVGPVGAVLAGAAGVAIKKMLDSNNTAENDQSAPSQAEIEMNNRLKEKAMSNAIDVGTQIILKGLMK